MTTVLVTGSNRGIGLELVRQYTQAGSKVIATSRNPQTADELKEVAKQYGDQVLIERMDVTDADSIVEIANKYRDQPIDILINNAGVPGPREPNQEKLHEQFFGSLNYNAWLDVLNANTLGPMRVAEAFVDQVAASEQKKIVTLSSTMGSIVEATMPAFLYSTSKTALNKAVTLMAEVLKERGIIAAAFCPGHVKTELGGQDALLEPVESVEGLRKLFDGLSMKDSGSYKRYNGETIAW